MSSVNKAILVGRLGKDPEARYTQGGAAVANFSLATDESYKDASGERQKKTEWHNIVVWGPSVDKFVVPYLHKGDLVYIEGKLQTRSWDDKGGNKRYTTEINVTEIKSLSTGDKNSSGTPAARQGQANTKPAAAAPAGRSAEVSDEDLPF